MVLEIKPMAEGIETEVLRVVGRQNLAHPQIQQLGDGAVFESSNKILPWFCCFGTSSDGLLLRSVPARTSSSKTLPCVSNCWLSTPTNLGGDSLPYTICSGSDCEDSGRNGRSPSSASCSDGTTFVMTFVAWKPAYYS